MSSANYPDAATAHRLLRDYFLSRTDIVAARQSWIDRKTKERVTQPRPVTGDAHLDSLIAFHVAGPDPSKAPALNYINRKTNGLVADKRGFDRVGSYAVAPDNTTAWLCLDFDGPSHPLPLADPLATMLACVEKCRAAGIPAHIEKSGSGHGWHLWVFFEAPVPAVDARLLGYSIAPTGHVLVTGEAADVRIGRGIECFPKQNTVSDKPFRAGNMVWLPFWYGAKDGGNQFHQVTVDGCLAPYAPDGFERLAAERLQEILAQVPDDIRRFVLKTKGNPKETSASKSCPPTTPGNFAPTDSTVVHAALDHISPDCSYDDWLRIGMALHHWDAQAGLAIWDAWSARGEKYVAEEPSLKWDGFTSGGGVTLGTLFDMAKKAGWEPPVHQRTPLPTDEEMAAFMDIDPSALFDQVQSDKRREIIECLLKAGRPLSPGEVAAETGRTINSAQKILFKMAQDGLIERLNHGTYKAVSCKQPDEKAVSKAECEAVFPKQPSSEAESKAVSPKQPTQTALQTDSAKAVSLKQPSETAFSTSGDLPNRRPTIVATPRDFCYVRDEAWAATLAANNPPQLFQRTKALVLLQKNPPDAPGIIPVTPVIMFDHLCSIAHWVRRTPDMETPVNPPRELPSVMVQLPHPTLPHLEDIVTTPTFDRAGNLIQTRGYHPAARLWLHYSPDFTLPEIPSHPSETQIADARALLLDNLFVDFPFTAQSSRAHAVAALLLPFVRRMIDGPTPIHLVESPSPGTGKSLLAKIISLIVLGRIVPAASFDLEEQAIAKKIAAILLGAPQVVLIDNINTRTGLKSSSLAAALTSEPYSERILYQAGMTELPNHALWLITANNPSLSLEIARRCVNIRIDSRTDRPWKRKTFKHTPLDKWVEKNRQALVGAIITIVRGWVSAGMQPADESFGSFDSWARTIGGILKFAEIPGFLGDLESLYEEADQEGGEWREFTAAWWDRFGSKYATAVDLLNLAIEKGLLAATIGDKSPQSQKIRIGRALSAMRDRQFGDYRITIRRDSKTKNQTYGLVNASDGEDGVHSAVVDLFSRNEQKNGGESHQPTANPPHNSPPENILKNQSHTGPAVSGGELTPLLRLPRAGVCVCAHEGSNNRNNPPPLTDSPQTTRMPDDVLDVDLNDFGPEQEEHK